MVIELGFEWIIAVFISLVYLGFPTLNLFFMFSPALQSNMLTVDSVWSVWFIIGFQISALVLV